MGSLATTFERLDGQVLTNGFAILMAMPLVKIVGERAYRQYGVMSPSQSVVILGLVAGATQLTVQGVGSLQLEKLSRKVNVLELTPAVAASIAASAVVAWALLPPNPNPVTTALDANGSLPS